MSGNEIRLANGQLWTAQQFLDHYLSPMGKPTPLAGPPAPVPVDMSWYMGEGPGRYYHPGMFKIINDLVERHDLGPGAYNLSDFATGPKDFSSVVNISHYVTDPLSSDYRTRALVFGNESAKISGKTIVNSDGSKRFEGIEIRPHDTDFNFEPKGGGHLLEVARARAKEIYDPDDQGVSYDIPFYGNGRTYEPFTDSQLNAARRREFVYPGTAPAGGWLPSKTDSTPRFLKGYLEYLDQANGSNTQTPESSAGSPEMRFVSSPNRSSSGNDIGSWIASLAGVDPMNPRQAAPQLAGKLRGIVSNEPMPDWPSPPPIFNTR
jgi:hypothetical protein